MHLNDWQKAVARTYSDGDYADFAETGEIGDSELDQCGDTLFEFLMLEPSDAEDCDSLEEALRRVESAWRRLDDALRVLQAL